MAKILALDLDGTLFYPKGRKHLVPLKNVEFLQKFIDSGNKVVLVTSRDPAFIERVIKCVGRDMDYIAFSGAVVKIDGQIVKDIHMDNEELKTILEAIRLKYKPIGYFLTSDKPPIIVSPFIFLTKWLQKVYLSVYKLHLGQYMEEIVVSKDEFYAKLDSAIVYAVKGFFGLGKKTRKSNAEINKAIREKYPSIESSWMGIVLEFAPKGCNKGESLTNYIDTIKANHDDVYVVGDSGNDISMFNAFHSHSFVMKHAYPSVKKYAKHKISRVYKLEKYLFERSKNE